MENPRTENRGEPGLRRRLLVIDPLVTTELGIAQERRWRPDASGRPNAPSFVQSEASQALRRCLNDLGDQNGVDTK